MKIAVVGWGDLIWDPGTLALQSGWSRGGPELPLEFCRISGGRRVILAILSGASPVKTYWALSREEDLVVASKNLRQRCKTFPDLLHHCDREGNAHPAARPEVVREIQRWLGDQPRIDSVVWVGLESNWPIKRGQPFEADDLLKYLDTLVRSGLAGPAREYFERTPPLNRTAVWRQVVDGLVWQTDPGD